MVRSLFVVCGVAAALAAAQPSASVITEARISPDGQRIAFTRQAADGTSLGLFTITIGGQEETRVAAPDGVMSEISWSANSDAIVYRSRPSAGLPGQFRRVPAGGGPAQTLDPSEAPLSLPRTLAPADAIVSVPDATILFVTAVAANQQALTLGNGRETWIDLATPSGSRVTVMPPGLARIIEPPSWSADGKRFAVLGAPPDGPPQIFGGFLPLPQHSRPDWVGAVPPMVRQLTGTAR